MSRRPQRLAEPKPPKLPPWEAALERARAEQSRWRLEISTVERPELADLLATDPIVRGIVDHGLLSKPNVLRVLGRAETVRRARVVTDADRSETLAVALDVSGTILPSGPKRKDAARTDWLVCLPPAPEPWTEPQLVRLLTPLRLPVLPPRDDGEPVRPRPPRPDPPGIEDLRALAVLGRATPPDPGDVADLAALAP